MSPAEVKEFSEKKKKFSEDIETQIGIYVYGLKDPRTNRYFYIGKGTGDRVYNHLKSSGRSPKPDPKSEIIDEIRDANLQPTFDLIRWGLPNDEIAFAIEAAIIDTLNVDQLSNLVRGHGKGIGFGSLSEDQVKEQFLGEDFASSEPFVAFKLNRLWTPDLTTEELYEATRKMWRIGPRRDRAEYALAVSYGIVREVYKIGHFSAESRWESFTHNREGKPLKTKRWGFFGSVAADLQHLVNTNVSRLPQAIGQNPVFYINC